MDLSKRRVQLTTALICAVAGLVLQFLIVQVRYGGNWTALFCTGSNRPLPALLADEGIYVFPHSTGYDGQMYHYVAHDPLIRTRLWRSMDNSRVRYRRILLPALAFVLAAGQQHWIDASYIGANLAFLFFGSWWLSRYLEFLNLDPRWGGLFLVTPAVLIALDRLTVDLAFTALCAGFALYLRLEQDAKAYAVLVLACLSRDTGFVLTGAVCLAFAANHKLFKAAALATAAIPAAGWYLYVNSRTPDYWDVRFRQLIPFEGIVAAVIHPMAYSFGAVMNMGLQWLDRLALLGLLLAAFASVWLVRRNGLGRMESAIVLWSALMVCLPASFFEDSYAGGRVFTPLLLYVMLRAWPEWGWGAAAPLAMALPRVLLQVVGPLLRKPG